MTALTECHMAAMQAASRGPWHVSRL